MLVVVLNAINQICKSTPGAAGSRSACGRAVGNFVPRHANVAGDPDDGPVDGAGPGEARRAFTRGALGPFEFQPSTRQPQT